MKILLKNNNNYKNNNKNKTIKNNNKNNNRKNFTWKVLIQIITKKFRTNELLEVFQTRR